MAIKQRPDSPTNNFATLNPLDTSNASGISEGNLKAYFSGAGNTSDGVRTNFGISTGKWYWEYIELGSYSVGGVGTSSHSLTTIVGYGTDGWGYSYSGGDNKIHNGGYVTYGTAHSTGDIIGVLVDMTGGSGSGTITFYLNGTSMGVAYSNLYGTVYPMWSDNSNGTDIIANFGQDHLFGGSTFSANATNAGAGSNTPNNGIGKFAFTVPTGAKALCTANLPKMTPTVDDDVPKDYFNTFLYDASGSSVQQFAHGFTFTPDFLWIKNRSSSSGSHWIYDRVRGFTDYDLTAGKGLSSASTAGEGGDVTLGPIIDPSTMSYPPTYDIDTHITIRDGNSAGVDTYNVNYPGHKYVVWGFRAGGVPTGGFTGTEAMVDGVETTCSALATSASASITPTAMSVNTDAGFSIVKYTGITASSVQDTIPHGLSSTPEFIIIKDLDNATNWRVYHKNITVNETLYLNLTDADAAGADIIYSPNLSTITLGNGTSDGGGVARNNTDHICYAWHSVENYSKFGSYIGNGSADGPFVYCGFRPAFVMVKNTTITSTFSSWVIYDNARTPNNPCSQPLHADSSTEEGKRTTGTAFSVADSSLDFLSNGFVPRTNYLEVNSINDTFVYAAFGEQPFNYANAR